MRTLKQHALVALDHLGTDRIFRYLNRDKLLVVMYHGVTVQSYTPAVWTQLPVYSFRRQLEFLLKHYQIVTLDDLVRAVCGEQPLPERAALITFDDGVKNNFTVAYPILREYGVPATIFLTMDLIGSDEFLWFDELYLLIREGLLRGVALNLPESAERQYQEGDVWASYATSVEALKRAGTRRREAFLYHLRSRVPLEREQWLEDFGLLGWDEVRAMERSGLVSFGVHTATHRILSELDDDELVAEVLAPRQRFSDMVGSETVSFCFPNGRPGIDFGKVHQTFLRSCGYRCAFTTDNTLFDWRSGDSMGIGRISVGDDITSDPLFFRLNASGALSFLKYLLNRRSSFP